MLPEQKDLYDWEPIFLAILNAVLKVEEEDETRNRDWGTTLFSLKHMLADCGAYFSMKYDLETATRICTPVVERIDRCPDYVADFVEQLIINAENAAAGKHFWQVWHLFADPVFDADRLRTKHLWVHDEKLIRALLLGTIPWKSEVREWKVLSEDPGHMVSACRAACITSAGFEATMRLLYSVGSFYLPDAFAWLAEALPSLDVEKVLSEKTNRFLLESLLRREIHLRSTEIRGNARLQQSVLFLLDVLVDFGSSVAFQLRERIIKPPRTS